MAADHVVDRRQRLGRHRADALGRDLQALALLLGEGGGRVGARIGVAGGRTNKEVAAQLYISVKTVQYHLTRVYAKLGIRSRTELAARYASGPDAGQGDGSDVGTSDGAPRDEDPA